MFETIITFPFVQIANVLRRLSFSSGSGNIIALILYTAFCLLPMVLFVRKGAKHNLNYTDALLPLTTILLFIAMYQLINPALINTAVLTKVLSCSSIYSVICTYLILTFIQLVQGKKFEKLCKYLSVLLWGLSIVLACYTVFVSTVAFPQSIQALHAANSANTSGLGLTYFFLFLGMLVEIIPRVAMLAVVLFSIRLVKSFSGDVYSERAVMSANKLSCVCKICLVATVLSSMIFNVLQYAFASQLRQINSNINISVSSLVFVLVVLIFSQIISEGKALKDDHDSII